MKRLNPSLLIVGTAASCETAAATLRQGGFAAAGLLAARGRQDALPLLKSRTDIGLVLVLWDTAETSGLPEMVSAIMAAHGDAMASVLVRCRNSLSEAAQEALWQLDTADRLFAQSISSADLAHSAATVLRDRARLDALAAVAGAAARLERVKTLWELAELVLAMLHERGIGIPGGLFCLLGGSATPSPMVVAGSGRYEGTGCMRLDDIRDPRAAAAIEQAMEERRNFFTPDAAVLYIRTPEGDVACIYLALDAPMTPWQQRLCASLGNAFSIAIGKNQAAIRLLRTQHATISTMATLAEYRDIDTGEHVARVARAVTEIAQVLADRGVLADVEMVGQIGLAAILHDIGKIAIPEGILLKPAALDPVERMSMETHTVLGRDILTRAAARSDNAELLQLAAQIGHRHHEKYDGSGYPDGLRGEEIPLAARIVALVDVFDALTSLRPYKEPWPYDKAIETIRAGSGSHFDPQVVDAFLSLESRRKSADFFVWNDAMSVGRPELDNDHKRLISIINRLWVAESNGNRQVIEFILDDLVHYTESHFLREEQMMDQVDYPEFERHRRIHQAICRRLEEIRWEYFQGIREELRGEILEFLKDWLHKHILIEDMSYRPYLKKWSCANDCSPLAPEHVK